MRSSVVLCYISFEECFPPLDFLWHLVDQCLEPTIEWTSILNPPNTGPPSEPTVGLLHESIKRKCYSGNWNCDGWVCDLDVMGNPSKLSFIREVSSLVRERPTLDLICEENPPQRPHHNFDLQTSPSVHVCFFTPRLQRVVFSYYWSCFRTTSGDNMSSSCVFLETSVVRVIIIFLLVSTQ